MNCDVTLKSKHTEKIPPQNSHAANCVRFSRFNITQKNVHVPRTGSTINKQMYLMKGNCCYYYICRCNLLKKVNRISERRDKTHADVPPARELQHQLQNSHEGELLLVQTHTYQSEELRSASVVNHVYNHLWLNRFNKFRSPQRRPYNAGTPALQQKRCYNSPSIQVF